MLQAQELRVGNKVQSPEGEVISIQQILGNSVIYDSQIKVNRELFNAKSAYRNTYTTEVVELVKESDFVDLKPVLLTPKVLEQCGFRNFVREEWILTIGRRHIDFEFTAEGLRVRSSFPAHVPVRYLHQLQNLMHVITGQELEVDL
jgi:hypothetical protein